MAHESYSVSQAARSLGISPPTVRRMAAEGELESFRTPGGHLRITHESLEAARHGNKEKREAASPSPVLRNRREELEELTLEVQKHRARRDLKKIQREEQEESERQEAEAQARQEEAAQRQAEIELERERLELEKAQERARQEREEAEEWERREAERELAAFRCRWQEKAGEALCPFQYRWLSAAQRKEVLDGLEAEIGKRQPTDEPRMTAIIARTLEALIEPLRAERNAKETRQRLTEQALRSLPYEATDAEKARAAAAIREALRRFDSLADVCEMQVAAQEAVQPVRKTIERRLMNAKLLRWATLELPWGRTDRDEAQVRRECAEILAELPKDVSEIEAREALEPTIQQVSQEIKQRQAERDRQARKANLIQQGVAEVSPYLLKLKHEGEISDEEFWDSDFNAELKEVIRQNLQADLTGDESTKDVLETVHTIIVEEFQ